MAVHLWPWPLVDKLWSVLWNLLWLLELLSLPSMQQQWVVTSGPLHPADAAAAAVVAKLFSWSKDMRNAAAPRRRISVIVSA
jgi:hypothetical protein